jgi:Eco29kI restriction endonuclease
MSRSKARAALLEVEEASKLLDLLAEELDPIKRPQSVFDPRDPRIIGLFIGVALVAQERRQLGSVVQRFYGSGVYALYYDGDFEAYRPISGTEHPIYVGKADPKNPHAELPHDQGAQLFTRLSEHRKSISLAQNLNIDQFTCRFLVVQSGLQKAAEDYLINLFDPVWNDWGLGKHGDKATTRANIRSPWDTLHPGRKWAGPSRQGKSPDAIRQDIKVHFDAQPPYKSIDEILTKFYEQLKQK